MKKFAIVFMLVLGLVYFGVSAQPVDASPTKKPRDYVSIHCKAKHHSVEYIQERRFPLRRVFVRDSERQDEIMEMLKPAGKTILRDSFFAILKPRIPIQPIPPYCKELYNYDFFLEYVFVTPDNKEGLRITLPGVRGEFVVVGDRFVPVLRKNDKS